jgi:hypothetical protein
MKRKSISFIAAIGLVAMIPSEVPAQVISFTGAGDVYNTGNPYVLGFEFSPNTSIDVTALGFFDAAQVDQSVGEYVGLATCTGCGEVGIYDSSGNLLVSTQVTTSGTLTGDFYYKSVSSTLLTAGKNYYIVAEAGSADYAYGTTGFSVSPSITYVEDAWIESSTLAYPTSTSDYTASEGGAYFGPNFEVAASAPEPSSFVLLGAGLLTVGLFMNRSANIPLRSRIDK